ncbi:hypothetical protein EPUS_00217 [Endocarpon pusillum Z07020]|uniref:Uncharacterized protein n=1 Tax=Endocarpon pusillum (strain Z07020 / HMAS-L-300199) TaxID=1263415 RepID=U1I0M2_ENDPU|nr:uncharacterized protein EPUS_00217 [Endocarpon pusillum Z07020]ERF75424.1 hypothetical protein EPUS_00217 [Endocarpon pusillum Z07020]
MGGKKNVPALFHPETECIISTSSLLPIVQAFEQLPPQQSHRSITVLSYSAGKPSLTMEASPDFFDIGRDMLDKTQRDVCRSIHDSSASEHFAALYDIFCSGN